jgi:hypothetical protein
MVEADPEGMPAVEVLGPRIPESRPGIDERGGRRMRIIDPRDRQRAACAVPRPGAVLVILRPEKIRKDVLPGPAGRTPVGPHVIVAARPPHVDHAVESTRPADDPAPRQEQRAPIRMLLWDGPHRPVEASAEELRPLPR